jgi:hypothetical protein
VAARVDETIAEAEQGLRGLLAAQPPDADAYGSALDAIVHRLEETRGTIDEVWDSEVESRFNDATDDDGFDDVGHLRKEEAELALAETCERFRVRWGAELYRALWAPVQTALARPVACTQCRGAIVRRLPHKSESIACAYCGAVNQVLPDPLVQRYFGSAGHAFGEEAAAEDRVVVDRFRRFVELERRKHDWWSEPVEYLDRWEQLERAYWERYTSVKAQLEGLTPAEQAAFVQSRMTPFRQYNLENQQHWRKAHGL